jgi:hypothetical protein
MVAEAATAFPQLIVRVTSAFGVHEKLAELILLRAGVRPNAGSADRCWHSSEIPRTCGDACRCANAPVAASSFTA